MNNCLLSSDSALHLAKFISTGALKLQQLDLNGNDTMGNEAGLELMRAFSQSQPLVHIIIDGCGMTNYGLAKALQIATSLPSAADKRLMLGYASVNNIPTINDIDELMSFTMAVDINHKLASLTISLGTLLMQNSVMPNHYQRLREALKEASDDLIVINRQTYE
jgi:Ran GTPase-activating protein (RanGAP) involved in mRNA processing and transport